jgi:hypothetical protein
LNIEQSICCLIYRQSRNGIDLVFSSVLHIQRNHKIIYIYIYKEQKLWHTNIISSAFVRPTRRGSRCVPEIIHNLRLTLLKKKKWIRTISHRTSTATHGQTYLCVYCFFQIIRCLHNIRIKVSSHHLRYELSLNTLVKI